MATGAASSSTTLVCYLWLILASLVVTQAYRGTVPIFPESAAAKRRATGGREDKKTSFEKKEVFAPKPIIKASGLSKTYESHNIFFKEDPVNALQDIHVEIEAPGAVALVGEAKAGKTTFLKCLAGLEKPTSGEITVSGLRKVVYVGRDTSRDSTGQSVRAIVREIVASTLPGAGSRGASVDMVTDNLLTALDLHKVSRTADRDLSGGEVHRFGVAVALAKGCGSPTPPVILLDGIFDKTDSRVRHGVQWALFDLQKELGVMLMFTAHSHQVIMEMAKLVVVISGGRITEVSTHERSRYARVMFERLRMDIENKAANRRRQQQGS